MNKTIVFGLLLLLAGFALLAIGSGTQQGASVGGFILIGPFPVVFGSGSYGGELALLSLVVGGVMVLLLFLTALRSRGLTHEGGEETDK